jgi:hypothetical protein
VKDEVLGYRDIPHSGQMHIKERFHLVAPDNLATDNFNSWPYLLWRQG